MDFDFNLILVPVTLFFLVIWLLDKFYFKRNRAYKNALSHITDLKHQEILAKEKLASAPENATLDHLADLQRDVDRAHSAVAISQAELGFKKEPLLISWAYDFLPVLAIVLCVRSFLFEPFNIPSESMVPTLQTGDFIIVNKFKYGVRLPILNTKFIPIGEPQRGDVAVFRYPENPKINFIKRIVGVPNDQIVFDNGILTINGKAISKELQPNLGDPSFEKFYREQLGTHTHLIRELNDRWSAQQAPFVNSLQNSKFLPTQGHHWEVTVPEGHYFAMGDNRDESADSRFWGFVPEKNLAGKAVFIWLHKPAGKFPTLSRDGVIE